jgi:hypothetical protein
MLGFHPPIEVCFIEATASEKMACVCKMGLKYKQAMVAFHNHPKNKEMRGGQSHPNISTQSSKLMDVFSTMAGVTSALGLHS